MFSRQGLASLLLLAALAAASPAGELRTAPAPGAAPVNQLVISGNACGPAALLASFRSGSPSWQKGPTTLTGTTDKELLAHWIRRHGLQPSGTLRGRKRWSNAGINVDDLVAATNEMTRPLYLPTVSADHWFIRRGESSRDLLKRAHDRISTSLAKGIPPVVSLRREVLRDGKWTTIQGHFVTITAVSKKLGRHDSSFVFHYSDPWGGKPAQGELRVPARPILASQGQATPCLEAIVPAANIGKKSIRRGELSVVIPAAAIGRW